MRREGEGHALSPPSPSSPSSSSSSMPRIHHVWSHALTCIIASCQYVLIHTLRLQTHAQYTQIHRDECEVIWTDQIHSQTLKLREAGTVMAPTTAFRLGYIRLGQVGLGWVGLGWFMLGYVKLDQNRLGLVRLGLVKLCQFMSDQVSLDQIRLSYSPVAFWEFCMWINIIHNTSHSFHKVRFYILYSTQSL